MFRNHVMVQHLLAKAFTALKLGAKGVLIFRSGDGMRLDIDWRKTPSAAELLAIELAGTLFPIENSVFQTFTQPAEKIYRGLHSGIRPLVDLLSVSRLAEVADELEQTGKYEVGNCDFSHHKKRIS